MKKFGQLTHNNGPRARERCVSRREKCKNQQLHPNMRKRRTETKTTKLKFYCNESKTLPAQRSRALNSNRKSEQRIENQPNEKTQKKNEFYDKTRALRASCSFWYLAFAFVSVVLKSIRLLCLFNCTSFVLKVFHFILNRRHKNEAFHLFPH